MALLWLRHLSLLLKLCTTRATFRTVLLASIRLRPSDSNKICQCAAFRSAQRPPLLCGQENTPQAHTLLWSCAKVRSMCESGVGVWGSSDMCHRRRTSRRKSASHQMGCRRVCVHILHTNTVKWIWHAAVRAAACVCSPIRVAMKGLDAHSGRTLVFVPANFIYKSTTTVGNIVRRIRYCCSAYIYVDMNIMFWNFHEHVLIRRWNLNVILVIRFDRIICSTWFFVYFLTTYWIRPNVRRLNLVAWADVKLELRPFNRSNNACISRPIFMCLKLKKP